MISMKNTTKINRVSKSNLWSVYEQSRRNEVNLRENNDIELWRWKIYKRFIEVVNNLSIGSLYGTCRQPIGSLYVKHECETFSLRKKHPVRWRVHPSLEGNLAEIAHTIASKAIMAMLLEHQSNIKKHINITRRKYEQN